MCLCMSLGELTAGLLKAVQWVYGKLSIGSELRTFLPAY